MQCGKDFQEQTELRVESSQLANKPQVNNSNSPIFRRFLAIITFPCVFWKIFRQISVSSPLWWNRQIEKQMWRNVLRNSNFKNVRSFLLTCIKLSRGKFDVVCGKLFVATTTFHISILHFWIDGDLLKQFDFNFQVFLCSYCPYI